MNRFPSTTRGHAARSSFLSGLLALVAASACGTGEVHTAERTITGSVEASRTRTLMVDSVVEVIVEGSPRLDAIAYELVATITASTATTAERIASSLVVSVDRPTEQIARLVLAAPRAGTIRGKLTVRAPSDLDLGVVEKASNVMVSGMVGVVQVDSLSSVRVVDPEGTVSIGVQRGNAIVDSKLPAGERTEILVGTGDIQLTIPRQVSASIEATAGGAGNVVVSHPGLPPVIGTRPYRTSVNGGLNTVRLSTMNGNVLIVAQ